MDRVETSFEKELLSLFANSEEGIGLTPEEQLWVTQRMLEAMRLAINYGSAPKPQNPK